MTPEEQDRRIVEAVWAVADAAEVLKSAKEFLEFAKKSAPELVEYGTMDMEGAERWLATTRGQLEDLIKSLDLHEHPACRPVNSTPAP